MKRILLELFDSLIRIALVAGLVLGVAWSLIQWAKHKPTLEADDSGSFHLAATTAHIHGPPKICLNSLRSVKNIGWWDYDTQWLSWKLDVAHAGRYRVSLRYARSGRGRAGVELAVGDATLAAAVPRTGGSSKWRTIEMGEIDLTAGSGQVVTLKAPDPPSPGIINFVHLEMTPQSL